ncbi:hypothetical protein GWI33_005988 [Rhynchophorus ferrugineus]|uniref:Uncharacterized protein n=1 Tax=Rhynchophorus ferrugineus TaxID=354439 RepID=A0A834MKT3_RHYFE|nr:hypothetical protein GWI33_005988 [Rhynchophorus ferrugineus]
MTFKKCVNPVVFKAVQNVDMEKLSNCSEDNIRPVLPCLVRMGLISPLDTSKKLKLKKNSNLGKREIVPRMIQF